MDADFEDFLVGERGLKPLTAHKRRKLLEHAAKTHGLDLDAFAANREAGDHQKQRLIARLTRAGHKPTSLANYAKALACLADYHGYRDFRIKVPTVTPPQGRAYSAMEMKALMAFRYPKNAFLERQVRAWLQFAYHTGMRPGEIAMVQLSDLDPRYSRVMLTHPEKGGRPRLLPVERELWSPKRPFMAWVNWLQAHPPPKPMLWWTRNQHTWVAPASAATFRNWHNHYVKPATGVDAYPYRMRHTRAVALYYPTKDIIMVKGYLGHAKLETTWNYLRSLVGVLEDSFRAANMPSMMHAIPKDAEFHGLMED